MADEEKSKVHKLLNLIFSEIHLVRHPANMKPILLLKSEDEDGDGQGGIDMNDEKNLGVQDQVVDEGALGMTDEDQSVASKALDIIKSLVGRKDNGSPLVKEDENEDNEDENGEEDLVDDSVTKESEGETAEGEVATGESDETPEADDEGDGDGDIGTNPIQVNTVKDLISAVQSNWDELPKALQPQVKALIDALEKEDVPGGGKVEVESPEEKPVEKDKDRKSNIEKSENEEKLEKSLDAQRIRLEKMETELANTRREKRLMELVPISKSVGNLGTEELYKLEALDSDLFDLVVKHMGSLQNRLEASEFFGETGTAAPIKKGSPTELLEKAARDYMTESGVKDYATALDHISMLPEHRDHIPQLYRDKD